jgi:hypothetical protein
MKKKPNDGLTKYQKFTVERWPRSRIKNAPYNPRTITDDARKRLKRNLASVGLVQTLTVNRVTGNLVAGHQRLAALDALERSQDYELDIAVVEMPEKTEREQNLFMNNPAMMGDWDLPALQSLLGEVDYTEAGFTLTDLAVLDIEVPADWDAVATPVQPPRVARKDGTGGVKARRAEYIAQQEYATATDFYLTVVFPDGAARAAFLAHLGFEPEDAREMQYVKCEIFKGLLDACYGK